MTSAGTPELAALVLAAGAGSRLAPLSSRRPKPLCPVGNVALLDLAVSRVADAMQADEENGASRIAVNICHGRATLEAHLDAVPWGRLVHRSIEPAALGTAGAVWPLRGWLDGRSLLIVNGDTWCPASLRSFVRRWDGERIAVAVSGAAPLHARSKIVASILPWSDVEQLDEEPAGLWERFWRDRLAERRLCSFGIEGPFVDCGTPADYLEANLLSIAGQVERSDTGVAASRCIDSLIDPTATLEPTATVERSVIGAERAVAGRLSRCVLWPGAEVAEGEALSDCVRTEDGLTVKIAGWGR